MKNLLIVVLVAGILSLASYIDMVRGIEEWNIVNIIVILLLLFIIIIAGRGIWVKENEDKFRNAKINAIVKKLDITKDDIYKELHK